MSRKKYVSCVGVTGSLLTPVLQDLFITVDLLEVQSGDRTGWFSGRETSFLDDVDIQTMYSHLMEVQPSSMISDSQDSVYRLLPPSIRSCIRAYNTLRRWIISKLVAPKLGIRNRQARMDLCLRAIEIARMRSLEQGGSSVELHERPVVRSFVEAVLTAAILSPESRMHQRAWHIVANSRGVPSDSLGLLLSRPTVPMKLYGDPLIVDISWLLERMLEVLSIPNAVAISSEDPQSIINLDKRRLGFFLFRWGVVDVCSVLMSSQDTCATSYSIRRRCSACVVIPGKMSTDGILSA